MSTTPAIAALHAGMIMAVRHLLKQNPDTDRARNPPRPRRNICRCTGYSNIVRAVEIPCFGGASP